ncbi:synapse differentiation-inducing gene protein 1-like isoform X2 [Acipenser ruthenus]|uniref:synapse differentiation-inducing gene protein 1-like isoform X2 n=1 Tax=Acipenser ruthenus TaxID=7906 RepID=UPI0027411B25|nr:synapse differentiation-inducing gene protein 1-like isoform X2 [Acipenser ruthenus]
MESLSELQNPLLDKTSNHVKGDYSYQGDFPSSQYQENIFNYFVSGSNKAKAQQLLDATSLHLAVEAFYRPNFILYKEDANVKNKDYKSECCETTFTEKKDPAAERAEDPEEKLLDLGENDVKIQTVSYEVEEEEYHEYELIRNLHGLQLEIMRSFDGCGRRGTVKQNKSIIDKVRFCVTGESQDRGASVHNNVMHIFLLEYVKKSQFYMSCLK